MKTPLNGILSLMAAAVLLVSCQNQSTPNPDEMKKIIEANNAKFGEGIRTKNADMIADLYTEDARIGPPGESFTDGKQKIREWWQGGLDYGLVDMKLTTTGLKGNGTVWYETGISEVMIRGNGSDSVMTDYDKYSVVWVKQADGSYKIATDMWNVNADPHAGAAEETGHVH